MLKYLIEFIHYCRIVWGRFSSERLQAYHSPLVDFEAVNSDHFLVMAPDRHIRLRYETKAFRGETPGRNFLIIKEAIPKGGT